MKILVADRNRRVGKFLKRELEKDSHTVSLADTGRELIIQMNDANHFDLLIIDPDLPDMESPDLFQFVFEYMPDIAIIIHTYLSDVSWDTNDLPVVAKVEKRGSSIDSIKDAIMQSPHLEKPWQ